MIDYENDMLPMFYFLCLIFILYLIYLIFTVFSGLLVSYLTLKELKKRGGIRKFPWGMYYFHRFWRYIFSEFSFIFACL